MDCEDYLCNSFLWYDLISDGRSCNVHEVNKKRNEFGEYGIIIYIWIYERILRSFTSIYV